MLTVQETSPFLSPVLVHVAPSQFMSPISVGTDCCRVLVDRVPFFWHWSEYSPQAVYSLVPVWYLFSLSVFDGKLFYF